MLYINLFPGYPARISGCPTYIKASIILNEMEYQGFNGTMVPFEGSEKKQKIKVVYGPFEEMLEDEDYTNPVFR